MRQDHKWNSGEQMTIAIPTQNAEPWKDYRSKEVMGIQSGYDEIDHNIEEMNKLINEKVTRKTLELAILKNGQPDLSFCGDHKHLYIQPSCKFIIGGVQSDTDLDGRAHELEPQHELAL